MIAKIKNVFFDQVCILCFEKNTSDKFEYLCKTCLESFYHNNENHCKICSHPKDEDLECPSCSKLDKIFFDSYRFIQYYTGFFKSIVQKWKRDDNFLISELFVKLLIENNYLKKDIPVTCVPSNFFKSFKKGRAGLNYILKLLKNKKFSVIKNIYDENIQVIKSQKEKSDKERIDQIKNKFYLKEKNRDLFSGEIYLIDDIYTTGSTMNYGAKLLKEAGFSKVHCLSFFRTIMNNS